VATSCGERPAQACQKEMLPKSSTIAILRPLTVPSPESIE
jgi:hypothetical protein